jgi:hypothetical protein
VTLAAHIRWLLACPAAVTLSLLAEQVSAQEPAPAPASESAPEGQTISEDVSYRGTVALLYGIGYAGTLTGYYMTRGSRPYGVRVGGAIVLPSAIITTLFGPMLVHLDHGSVSKGLVSAGGQVAAAGVGIAGGYGIASIAGADERGIAMLIGGLSLHAGWALFDTLVLAQDERVVDRTIPAPTYALSLLPMPGGGVQAGAGFRF